MTNQIICQCLPKQSIYDFSDLPPLWSRLRKVKSRKMVVLVQVRERLLKETTTVERKVKTSCVSLWQVKQPLDAEQPCLNCPLNDNLSETVVLVVLHTPYTHWRII